MADWGAALVAWVEGDAALVAALGSDIDWGMRPEEAGLPQLLLSTVTDLRPDHFRGEQGLRVTRVQADVYSAVSADEATRIMEMFIRRVRPEPGTGGSAADGSYAQDGVRFDRPQVEGPVDGGEQLDTLYVHRARADVFVWHAEEEEV